MKQLFWIRFPIFTRTEERVVTGMVFPYERCLRPREAAKFLPRFAIARLLLGRQVWQRKVKRWVHEQPFCENVHRFEKSIGDFRFPVPEPFCPPASGRGVYGVQLLMNGALHLLQFQIDVTGILGKDPKQLDRDPERVVELVLVYPCTQVLCLSDFDNFGLLHARHRKGVDSGPFHPCERG